MCQVLYIAADRELPLIAWHEQTPAFHVTPLPEREEAVRRHFSKPHVYYLGAHTGCSCGFAYGHLDLRDEKDQTEDTASRASTAGLRAYLAQVSRDGDVELYSCWEGDWYLPAEHRFEVTTEHFGGDTFSLTERAFYLVKR